MDGAPQFPRIGRGIEDGKMIAGLGAEHGFGEEPLIRRRGRVPRSAEPSLDDLFVAQVQHGLKQVVIELHLVVERVESGTLLSGVQSRRPKVGANQGVVLLLDEPIVVFMVWPAPAQRESGDGLAKEAHQVVVKELGPVIRMELFDRKGQPIQHSLEPCLHTRSGHFCRLTPSQYSSPFAPAGGYINELECMHIVASGTPTRMMDQIRFKVPRFVHIPRNTLHRYRLAYLIGLLRAASGQAGRILPQSSHNAPDCCSTDHAQLVLHVGTQAQFSEAREVPRGVRQDGGEALGTDVIQTFPDHPNHLLGGHTVGASSAHPRWVTLQTVSM